MKILYRPQMAGLAEAMKQVKEFNIMDELLDYLVADNKVINGISAFDKKDIYIKYYCYDERIDWDTYLVCVSRFYNEDYINKYHCPQAIGFMTFKEN